jgi:hypothetical protein
LLLAATVYNLKKWLRFTTPKVVVKAAQMINPKLREGFCLIKNLLLQLYFKTSTGQEIFSINRYAL